MGLTADLSIVTATLLGPVLAVQAQKYLERRREAYARRSGVFRTLMTTRGARLSPAHVEALNLIDLEFYDPQRRFLKQNRSLARVRAAWVAYDAHLASEYPSDKSRETVYLEHRNELFVDLLYEMANALGYDEFDKNTLRKLSYVPKWHGDIEADQVAIRRGMAEVMAGRAAIPMKVVEFPFAVTNTPDGPIEASQATAATQAASPPITK